jgi:outer membrane protein TolC
MKKRLNCTLGVALVIWSNVLQAQSSDTLTLTAFLQWVKDQHPLAQTAQLYGQLGELEVQSAKGNFDPQLNYMQSEKSVNEKTYFNKQQAQITIPTPLGLDVMGQWENNGGVYVNQEDQTNSNHLLGLGVEVNLLQGLMTDERRVALKQAQLAMKSSQVEKQLLTLDLLNQASQAYLDWQKNVRTLRILEESVQLARLYLNNVKISYEHGEKNMADTLEAHLVYNDRTLLLENAKLETIKSKNNVENFLWNSGVPVALRNTVLPQNEVMEGMQENLILSPVSHPLLEKKSIAIQQLQVDQKIKIEKIKPKLKLKYQPLLSTTSFASAYSPNGYKYGLQFSTPLYLRQERANLSKNKLKILEAQNDLNNKKQEWTNKLKSNLSAQINYQMQITIQKKNAVGYRTVLEIENEKFNMGESSVFLVNKRQEKLLECQLKLVELEYKYQIEQIEYLYLTQQL